MPPSVFRDLGRAEAAGRARSYLVTIPTAAGPRLVITYQGADGKYRTRLLPAGVTKDKLAAALAPLGIPPPEETP